MSKKLRDWTVIANSPKFVELNREKTRFLFGWWIIGSLSYFALLLAAAYIPGMFRLKVLGNINLGYILCLLQFFISWAIAMFYAYKANKDFDRLARELVAEIN